MRNHILLSTTLFCLAAGSAFGSVNLTSSGTISIPATNENGNLQSKAVTASGITGSISTITVTLNNWNDNGGDSDREMMLVFQPTGCTTNTCLQTFQFLGDFGSYDSLSSYTVTFADSGTNYAPGFEESSGNPNDKPPVNGATYKPTVNYAGVYCSGEGGNAAFAGAPVSSASCATDNPSDGLGSDGTATFASQFSGSANGTWTLYIWTNASGEDPTATIASWTLGITTQANAANTTTTLSSNATNNETFETDSVTLTATVSSTSTVSEGIVDFTDNGNTMSNCGAVAVSGGVAQCTTSFSTEGNHPLEAAYSGGTDFGTSHGTLNFFVDHTTSNPSSGVYCNTGTITINTNTSPGTTPYPQHITIRSTSFTISDVSLTLNSISTPAGIGFFNFLLVDPNGHKFVPLAGTGGYGSAGNVTLVLGDGGSSPVPNPTSGAPASGTYLPTDDNSGLSFASSPDGPPAGPYSLPQTQGGATFDDTFGGANPTGQWSLYAYYTSGASTGSIGGYCLNITTSNAASTATTVTSAPNGEAATGESVIFTATVKSGGSPISSGSITFKENGSVLSGPTTLNGSGQATFTTSSLSEGVHTIAADYSGVTGTYQVSSGMVTIEIDTATTNPTASVYCNPGGIKSGSGTQNIPAAPYPSRVNVTNLAGTVNTVGVQLNPYTSTEPDSQLMLLEGPTATNIVFWNNVGGTDAVSSFNMTIADSAGSGDPIPTPPGSSTYYPTSDTSPYPSPTFPAPAPSSLSFAPPQGAQTFTSAFGASGGINPNGYWSLWIYDRFGSAGLNLGNWCLNVTNHPPVVTLAKVHNGTFTQGDPGDTYTITVANPSGPGFTAGTVTLTDTLPTGITAISMVQASGGTGSDWTCSVGTVSCTRTTPMAPGETDTFTLTVSVGYNASTSTNGSVNNVSLSGGGISGGTVNASDTQTVQVGPGYVLNLSVNPAGAGTATANPTNSAGLAAGHYVPQSPVSLTATPNNTATSGYTFVNWTGSSDVANASSASATIQMNSATENVTANFTVVYTQVTSGVSVTSNPFVYNKIKKQGTATYTVKNTSGQTISGPVQLVLSGMAAGVNPANNTGSFMSNPYWTLTGGSLAPGASLQVTVILNYNSGIDFMTNTAVYSGNLQ